MLKNMHTRRLAYEGLEAGGERLQTRDSLLRANTWRAQYRPCTVQAYVQCKRYAYEDSALVELGQEGEHL